MVFAASAWIDDTLASPIEASLSRSDGQIRLHGFRFASPDRRYEPQSNRVTTASRLMR